MPDIASPISGSPIPGSPIVRSPILGVFDFVWERLRARLVGLTDDEYFWEPVAGCWTLRRDDSGQWELDGGGGGGPVPDPAPITTIAWRIGHLGGMALSGFTDRRFPDLAVADLAVPTDAPAALEFMDQTYARWREGLESLTSDEWWQPLGPAWGPYSDDSTLDLALHVLDELVHHGAEISLLRDLYAHRSQDVHES